MIKAILNNVMTHLRILLVDDHEVVRLGLKSLIERHPGFEVVVHEILVFGFNVLAVSAAVFGGEVSMCWTRKSVR